MSKLKNTVKTIVTTLSVVGGITLFSNSAQALQDTGPGFYWTCDAQTGDFVCGYSSPYGHCFYETSNGVQGYMPTGGRLIAFEGYDCRQTMPNGPFWGAPIPAN